MKVNFIDSLKYHLEKIRNSKNRKEYIKIFCIKYIPILILGNFIDNFIIKLLVVALWWVIITIFIDHKELTTFDPVIRIWFGVPGSGKTSIAAWLCRNSLKQQRKVLSNVQIKGAYRLDDDDLGKYDMSFGGDGAHVIIDEALVKGLYNRQFKAFANSGKPLYFSEHRHMNNMVDVFSQGYDIDLNVKQRAGSRGLFHLSKLPISGFIMYRRISKIFYINKEDKQFVDGFTYAGLPRIVYTRSVWNTFDTKDMTDCPKEQKKWELWHFDDDVPLGV